MIVAVASMDCSPDQPTCTSLPFSLDRQNRDSDLWLVGEESGNKSPKAAARRRMISEALILFVFAWLSAVAIFLLRPPPAESYAGFGPLRFVVATLINGFESFVFGYLLSRFFKQFRMGCAFVIILFFTYLFWAGRHPH
jgi:hypothetical protein